MDDLTGDLARNYEAAREAADAAAGEYLALSAENESLRSVLAQVLAAYLHLSAEVIK